MRIPWLLHHRRCCRVLKQMPILWLHIPARTISIAALAQTKKVLQNDIGSSLARVFGQRRGLPHHFRGWERRSVGEDQPLHPEEGHAAGPPMGPSPVRRRTQARGGRLQQHQQLSLLGSLAPWPGFLLSIGLESHLGPRLRSPTPFFILCKLLPTEAAWK